MLATFKCIKKKINVSDRHREGLCECDKILTLGEPGYMEIIGTFVISSYKS